VLVERGWGQNTDVEILQLNLGADTLPLMRREVDSYLTEMKDWERETLSVMPSTNGPPPLMDTMMGKIF
jgi:hypothetical protein